MSLCLEHDGLQKHPIQQRTHPADQLNGSKVYALLIWMLMKTTVLKASTHMIHTITQACDVHSCG